MPLNAAIRQVLQPIVAIGQAYLSFFSFFIVNSHKKSRVYAKAPIFNKGATYRMKEKGLIKMSIRRNCAELPKNIKYKKITNYSRPK